MATVSVPISAWVASISAGESVAQSSSLTFTVNITAGWEVQVPIALQMSSVSADPVVNVFPSMDGGANYDTSPMSSFSIARVVGKGQTSVRLSTGQYVLQVLNSGPNNATAFINTQLVITAINNV